VATATLENKSVGPKSEKDIAVAFRQKFIGVYNSLAFRMYRYFFKQFFSIIIHYILYTLTILTPIYRYTDNTYRLLIHLSFALNDIQSLINLIINAACLHCT